MRTAAVLAIALALAVAGCGKSSPSSSSSSSISTPALPSKPTPATKTGPISPTVKTPDSTLATAALLKLKDFPKGWTQAPVAQTSPDPDCPEVKAARKLASNRESAPDFSHGTSARTQSVVYSYADASTAAKAFAGLSTPSLRACIGRITRKLASGAAGITVGALSSTPLQIPAVGSARLGFRLAVPVSGKGQKAELDEDIVLVRTGRAISVVAMLQETPTFDAALRKRLVTAAAKHLGVAFPPD